MRLNGRRLVVCAIAAAAFAGTRLLAQTGSPAVKSPPRAGVIIEKPKPRTETYGGCRILADGTFSGSWGPSGLPTLAFTIGPGATMADAMHANKARFTGPGRYPDEIIAVYLGKTALEDGYGGLGTIVIAADGHSGTFTTNDGKASGRFDCGAAPSRHQYFPPTTT
jgi:hypothetical protein